MPAPMAVPNSASTQLQAGPSDLVAALLIEADPGGTVLYLGRIKESGKRPSVLRLCYLRHRVAQCIFWGVVGAVLSANNRLVQLTFCPKTPIS